MDALIKEDMERDLLSNCLGGYYHAQRAIRDLDNMIIKPTDSKALQYIKRGDFEKTLSELGILGEYAYKYILKKYQTELFPREDYNQFKAHLLFKPKSIEYAIKEYHDGRLPNGVTFNSSIDIDKIKAYNEGTGPLFHNYNYLSLVTEELLPSTIKNLKKYYKYRFQSEYALQIAEMEMNRSGIKDLNEYFKDNYEYLRVIVFPSIEENSLDYDSTPNNKYKEIKKIGEDAGDSFVRFRYFSENVTDPKQFTNDDLNKINSYLQVLIDFTSGIYVNNDLHISAERLHGKDMALMYSDFIGRSKEEIEELFDNHYNDNLDTFIPKLFCDYEIEEINEIDQRCNDIGILKHLIYGNYISLEGLNYIIENGYEKPFLQSTNTYTEEEIEKNANEMISLIDLDTYNENQNNQYQEDDYNNSSSEDYLDEETQEILELGPKAGLDYYDRRSYTTETNSWDDEYVEEDGKEFARDEIISKLLLLHSQEIPLFRKDLNKKSQEKTEQKKDVK